MKFYKYILKMNRVSSMTGILLMFFFLGLINAYQHWYEDRNALVLNPKTIAAVLLRPFQIKVMTFLTPSCTDCQGMTSVLDFYEYDLQKAGRRDINLYQVNCIEYEKLCNQMKVTNLPFIFVFGPSGMVEEQIVGGIYNHEQTLNMIKDAVKRIDNGQAMKIDDQRQNNMRAQKNYYQVPQVTPQAPPKPNMQQETPASPQNPPQNIPEPGNQQSQVTKPNQEKTETAGQKKGLSPQIPKKEDKAEAQAPVQNTKETQISPRRTIQEIIAQSPPESEAEIQQSHEKLLNNVKKSRQKKQSFFSLKNGSVLTSLVLIVLGVGIGIYLKNVLSHSSAIKKVIAGDNVYYSYPKEEEAEGLSKADRQAKSVV